MASVHRDAAATVRPPDEQLVPTPSAPVPDLRPSPPDGYKWVVLAVVGGGIFMSTLSMGMVNVALPTIGDEFDAPLGLVQWVVLGYILSITSLLLPMGRLADMVGRKRVFLGGYAVFTLSSLLCGVAPTLALLIAARVLQGVGGAMMQANMGALIATAFPAAERGRAMGMTNTIVMSGALTGPAVGGALTQYLGWPWTFFLVVPLGVVSGVAGVRLLRPSPALHGQRFDLAGAALFTVTVVALLLALNQAPVQGWTAPEVLALLAAAVAHGALFFVVERRVPQPTVDFSLFANRGFASAITAGWLLFLGMGQVGLLMPFYLQLVLGLPPGEAGLVLIALPATTAVLASWTGALSDRIGTRAIATTGMVVVCLAALSLAALGTRHAPLDVVARLALLGLGVALFQPPNNSALYSAVARERLGVAGAFQALMRNLGNAAGQAVGGAVWTAVVAMRAAGGAAATAGDRPASAATAAMLTGFRVVFLVVAALAALAAVVSFAARPREGASEPHSRPGGH